MDDEKLKRNVEEIIAKNYLNEQEIKNLNNLVNLFWILLKIMQKEV